MDGDLIHRDRMNAVLEFIKNLRSVGFETKGYDELLEIDHKLIEYCLLELTR